jgi:NADPH:quinone reductase-like Zn-dependent oxidoreductase
MKAAQFENTGKPEEVLSIVEKEIPVPGPGEVRVKIKMSNINPSDIMFVQGMYGITPKLPAIGGFEAAGIIDAVGEGVSLKPGQRVIFTAMGVWQEYAIVNAKGLIPTPEHMTDEVACQAFVNPFTAYAMLAEAQLEKGDWLLITAGASAFGKFVIQLCKQRGINTVCTVRHKEQIDFLKNLGATEVINTEESELVGAVKTLTSGKGVNCCFDAVGGKLGGAAVDSLANNGLLLAFGLLSLRPTPVNTGGMIFKNLTIKGFWLSTWMTTQTPEKLGEVTKAVLTQLTSQELKADIEATYKLEDIKKAIVHAEKPGKNGKVLLDMR